MGLFGRKRTAFGPKYVYTEDEARQFEAFIGEHFGHFDEVLHEIISPDIHLDVIIMPPTERDNYYTLITMGMGAYRMRVPRELRHAGLERAELVLHLPPDWDIKSGDERNYWPIRQLKALGRLPVTCRTWLGYGHTVSADAEHTPFADGTDFCAMLLLDAAGRDGSTLGLRMATAGNIKFYQAVPIYKEELEYKMEHGLPALLDLFGDDGLPPPPDMCRKNRATD